MMAYNHSAYISQAVESVLMQETDFAFEVLIGEDRSQDDTREKLARLQEKYPQKINLLLNEHNIGIHKNLDQLLGSAKGEYIAILEGDDYWTSPNKLQKQIDFLEDHSDFTVCFHNALMVNEENSPLRNYCPADQKAISGFDDLLVENFIPTCSIVFRGGLLPRMPAWTETLPMLDWPLLILLAGQGKIGYINEVMGVYRVHAGGIWSTQRHLKKLIGSIEFLSSAKGHLGDEHEKKIEERLAEFWQLVSAELYDRADEKTSIEEAISFLDHEIKGFPKGLNCPKSLFRKLYGKVYAAYGFRHYDKIDYGRMRYCWRKAIYHDASWLANRGVWSIYIKSIVGNGK